MHYFQKQSSFAKYLLDSEARDEPEFTLILWFQQWDNSQIEKKKWHKEIQLTILSVTLEKCPCTHRIDHPHWTNALMVEFFQSGAAEIAATATRYRKGVLCWGGVR